MSFGDGSSKYQSTRDTATRPTKSMVIGMLACAMGILRDDPKIEKLYNDLVVYTTTINKGATLWQDYQNAHVRELDNVGNYGSRDDKNIQRWKTYILNGKYVIFVGSDDDEQLKLIHDSITRPFWPLFIGRKCCTFSSCPAERILVLYDESDLGNLVCSMNNDLEENVELCICQ
jgi:CRISPR system Cascade subunit CasD